MGKSKPYKRYEAAVNKLVKLERRASCAFGHEDGFAESISEAKAALQVAKVELFESIDQQRAGQLAAHEQWERMRQG